MIGPLVKYPGLRRTPNTIIIAPDESLEIFGYLEDILHKATRDNFEEIILGDLNCDCLKSELKQTERMHEFLMANELTQMIAEPTRVVHLLHLLTY